MSCRNYLVFEFSGRGKSSSCSSLWILLVLGWTPAAESCLQSTRERWNEGTASAAFTHWYQTAPPCSLTVFLWQSGCTACFNLPNHLSCTEECAAVSSDNQNYLSCSGSRDVEVLLVCLGHSSVCLQVQQNSVMGTEVIQDSVTSVLSYQGRVWRALRHCIQHRSENAFSRIKNSVLTCLYYNE